MAGTLQRASVSVLRRATTAGLGGLAFALFVGVMAFAVTTNPSSEPDDSMTRYFTTASTVVDLTTAASNTPAGVVDAFTAVVSLAPPPPSDLETTGVRLTLPRAQLDVRLTRALASESRARASSLTSADELIEAAVPAEVASQVAPTAEAANTPAPLEVATYASYEEPALAPGDVVEATVSFYYCERGVQGLHPGDGGGFCGVMRDGTVVYPGAAACAYKYLGQRFRIVGDPASRAYVCADTGSAVHGLHRDIWFMSSDEGWDWQRVVGQVAVIEILP